jgi:hypothetical protein
LIAGTEGELEQRFRGLVKAHVMTHDRRAAVRAVTAKAGYWKGERVPSPTTSPGRCRACEYNLACPKSLARNPRAGESPKSDSGA